jgi:hypothetical protein
VNVPVGTVVDTTGGRAAVTAAVTKGTRRAVARGGVFRLAQKPSGLTTLTLTGGKPKRCGRRTKPIRKLELAGAATFQVAGRRSRATGGAASTWTTEDRCAGTRTRVTKGRVTVLDTARHRTVKLGKGKSYLARG